MMKDHGLLSGDKIIAGVYRAEFSMSDDGVQENWISWVDPGTEKPDFHVASSFGEFVLVQ